MHQSLVFLDETIGEEQAERLHKNQHQQHRLVGELELKAHLFQSEILLEDDVGAHPQHHHQRHQIDNHCDGDDLDLADAILIAEEGNEGDLLP